MDAAQIIIFFSIFIVIYMITKFDKAMKRRAIPVLLIVALVAGYLFWSEFRKKSSKTAQVTQAVSNTQLSGTPQEVKHPSRLNMSAISDPATIPAKPASAPPVDEEWRTPPAGVPEKPVQTAAPTPLPNCSEFCKDELQALQKKIDQLPPPKSCGELCKDELQALQKKIEELAAAFLKLEKDFEALKTKADAPAPPKPVPKPAASNPKSKETSNRIIAQQKVRPQVKKPPTPDKEPDPFFDDEPAPKFEQTKSGGKGVICSSSPVVHVFSSQVLVRMVNWPQAGQSAGFEIQLPQSGLVSMPDMQEGTRIPFEANKRMYFFELTRVYRRCVEIAIYPRDDTRVP